MNVTFRANDLQALISQPQKFSTENTPAQKPTETAPNTEEKPKKHGSTGKGFFWGAVATLAAAIMIAGKGNPSKGIKLLLGGFEKLTKEGLEKAAKLKDEAFEAATKVKDEAVEAAIKAKDEALKLKDEAIAQVNKLKKETNKKITKFGKRSSKTNVDSISTKKSYVAQQMANKRAKRAKKAARK